MKDKPYTPLTAAPFRKSEAYREMPPLLPELAAYIRCFWGSEQPFQKKKNAALPHLVVPDTCADIIYYVDYTDNMITGRFYGVNDASFPDDDDAGCGHLVSVFAIRFYAWGVYAFSEDSLKGTMNGCYDVGSRFSRLDAALRRQLWDTHTLAERTQAAEALLWRQMSRLRRSLVVDQAVRQILLREGNRQAAELARECFVSGRQLERLFHEYIGITPKKLCNLVRYQFLWNEIVRNPHFHIAGAAYRYGYADQSHLMREFKRYHGMDIRTAKAYAFDFVENIQDFHNREW